MAVKTLTACRLDKCGSADERRSAGICAGTPLSPVVALCHAGVLWHLAVGPAVEVQLERASHSHLSTVLR